MRQHRTDANQKQIIEELRQLSFSVAVTSASGNGFPDIVVGDGRSGRNFLFEIKDEKGKPNKAQIKFAEEWNGQYAIIRSTEQALEIMDKSV